MDKRAGELNAEYLAKAKHTDQTYCGTPRDTVGPVELKLGSLSRVHGIVVGAFGEASDDLHSLIPHLAVSRVRFAGPQVGRRGQVRTEEAEIALATSFLRKSLSECAVRSQAELLLRRLEEEQCSPPQEKVGSTEHLSSIVSSKVRNLGSQKRDLFAVFVFVFWTSE